MSRSRKLWPAALGTLLASGCAEHSGEESSVCELCISPIRAVDAGSVLDGEAPAPPRVDGEINARGQRDAEATVVGDAGRSGRDGGSTRDGAVVGVAADSGPRNVNEAGATDAGTTEAGATDSGAIVVDAGDAGPECSAAKARDGEPCTSDADCDAGLLCNAQSNTCRAITGIKLLRNFSPSGRSDAYSEGLDFAHGSLWQSTAETLYRIDVAAQAVVASYPTPSEYGEGLSWGGNVLYHASYRNSNLYAGELIGDRLSFEVLGQLQMTGGCVYGIVEHCGQLYTTRCGRSVVDVYASGTTTPILRTFTVRDTQGAALPEVEDLEIYRGQLWTSTFNSRSYVSTLFRVDMMTNQAVAAYEIPCSTLAIDGVAADPSTRTLFVTGKDCPIFVYQVE
ncbi:MAG TPA: glutaminyl-peptide cyclotransferase [Polyangiales bacterium]|nr:glutaminyl-peptide cyclotransferase [Polyangiales bacterium]